ncbi:MAG: hypothetical protein H0U71_06210 [Gammaproteobacteria bacterium]|nr:hypothetical protein [Gammaproteobacteria bacterium]
MQTLHNEISDNMAIDVDHLLTIIHAIVNKKLDTPWTTSCSLQLLNDILLIIDSNYAGLLSLEDVDKAIKQLDTNRSQLFYSALFRNLLCEKKFNDLQTMLSDSFFHQLPLKLNQLFIEQLKDAIGFAKDAQQFGYKGAYLKRWQHLLSKSQLKLTTTFKVPDFVLISNDDIVSIIREHTGTRLEKLWEAFLTAQGNSKDTILPEALSHLEKINTILKEVFFDSSEEIVKFFVQPFFNTNHQITCRSTSNEDTSESTNAGGNKTVTHLDNIPGLRMKSLLCVLQSYFSKQSLSQRLGQEKNITFPLMSIIFQDVVGEKIGGSDNSSEIVTSGVLNAPTNDTPGFTSICCRFGHGEAVVNGADSDTFIVDNAGSVVSIIKSKSSRLVPVRDPNNSLTYLTDKKNPASIKNRASIPENVAKDLALMAREIQINEGKKIDLEFVYDARKKTVFIVQVRPQPFVAPIKASSLDRRILPRACTRNYRGETIIMADQSTRVITNIQEIIFGRSVKELTQKFIDHPRKSMIKAALTHEKTNELAHIAIILKSYNIVMLRYDELDQIQCAIQKHQGPVIIDPNEEETILSSELPSNAIRPGLTRHPQTPIVSVLPLVTDSFYKNNQSEEFSSYTDYELLEIAKEATNPDNLKHALSTLQDRHYLQVIKEYSQVENELIGWKRELQLENAETSANLLPNLFFFSNKIQNQSNRDPHDLRRLFYFQPLKATLFQTPSANVAASHSFKSQEQNTKSKFKDCLERLIDVDKTVSKKLIYNKKMLKLAKVGWECSLSENVGHSWVHFIDELRQTMLPDQEQQMIELLNTLAHLQIVELWLNTSFYQTWKLNATITSGARASNVLKALLHEMNTLAEVMQRDGIIDVAQSSLSEIEVGEFAHLSSFRDPSNKSIRNMMAEPWLKLIYLYMSINNSFADLFHKGNIITKQIVLNFLLRYIHIIDAAIKELKGSPEISTPEKVATFIKSLTLMVNLLHTILMGGLFKPKDKDAFGDNLFFRQNNFSYEIVLMLKFLNSISTNEMEDDTHLQESPDFEVARNLFNNKYGNAFYYSSAEEVFTTLHQNLLGAIDCLFANYIAPSLELPPLLAQHVALIEDSIGNLSPNLRLQRCGMNFGNQSLVCTYNLPLRVHSMKITCSYHKVTKSITTCLHFNGVNCEGRWHNIAALVTLFVKLSGLSMKDVVQFPDLTLMTITLTSDRGFDLKLIKTILQLSVTVAAPISPIEGKYLYHLLTKEFKFSEQNIVNTLREEGPIQDQEHDSIIESFLDSFFNEMTEHFSKSQSNGLDFATRLD